jgi:hypothetical protein
MRNKTSIDTLHPNPNKMTTPALRPAVGHLVGTEGSNEDDAEHEYDF